VLDLARRCRRLVRLGHVSTVYVCGRAAGAIAEAPAPPPAEGFSNAYQESKHEAEAFVLQAMGDVPAAIYRLSSLVGDSRSGRVGQFNHVHQLVRLFPRNVLPVMPAEPRAPVDLVPSDWVAGALVHLFDETFVPGAVAQLCAGREGSLTVQEVVDLTRQAYARHPLGRRWGPIRAPELVPLAEYERYVARHRQGSDRLYGELLRVLDYFLPHLGIEQAFENHLAMDGLAGAAMPLPPIRSYYEKVVRYCLDTWWGTRIEASAMRSA
jgi:nucleoside-diphosphate-sugar epimerase